MHLRPCLTRLKKQYIHNHTKNAINKPKIVVGININIPLINIGNDIIPNHILNIVTHRSHYPVPWTLNESHSAFF